MNQPTPDPSWKGSRRSSAAGRFPSWEGLGVGSWSPCMRKNEKGAFHEPPALPPFRLCQGYGGHFGHPLPLRGERDGARGLLTSSGRTARKTCGEFSSEMGGGERKLLRAGRRT